LRAADDATEMRWYIGREIFDFEAGHEEATLWAAAESAKLPAAIRIHRTRTTRVTLVCSKREQLLLDGCRGLGNCSSLSEADGGFCKNSNERRAGQ